LSWFRAPPTDWLVYRIPCSASAASLSTPLITAAGSARQEQLPAHLPRTSTAVHARPYSCLQLLTHYIHLGLRCTSSSSTMIQLCSAAEHTSLPTYADNVALPAFARRTRCRSTRSTSRARWAHSSKTCSSGFAAVRPRWDRQMDGHHRPCSACRQCQ